MTTTMLRTMLRTRVCRWELLLARIFGKQVIGYEYKNNVRTRVVIQRWRGRFYLIDHKMSVY
jgi:hypothetical protein